MEMIIVVAIISLAALYVGYTFYKQFTGKGGCSSGCSCDTVTQDSCEDPRKNLENLQLK
jgi:hypothetical protein